MKNVCILWCWNLQNTLELPFSFCINKKLGEILIFRTFIAKVWILNVRLFFAKKIAIFGSGMFLWRHNYVTPWPIVLILVCMNREDPYLPVGTKINSIGGLVRKIYGGGCNKTPLVRRVTKKNSLVRRALSMYKYGHPLLAIWWFWKEPMTSDVVLRIGGIDSVQTFSIWLEINVEWRRIILIICDIENKIGCLWESFLEDDKWNEWRDVFVLVKYGYRLLGRV